MATNNKMFAKEVTISEIIFVSFTKRWNLNRDDAAIYVPALLNHTASNRKTVAPQTDEKNPLQ